MTVVFYGLHVPLLVRWSCPAGLCRLQLHQPPGSHLRLWFVCNVLLKSFWHWSGWQRDAKECQHYSGTLPSPCPSSTARSYFAEVRVWWGNTALPDCWWPWATCQPPRSKRWWYMTVFLSGRYPSPFWLVSKPFPWTGHAASVIYPPSARSPLSGSPIHSGVRTVL